MKKIILDTDIGDDIDDALALGVILGCEQLELVGVTTVFGNTYGRAALARTILKQGGRGDIPVAAGCGASLSFKANPALSEELQKNPMDLYLTKQPLIQGECCFEENQLPALCSSHGVDFIINKVMKGDGDVTLITIGALTNIAMAIIKEPRIISKIPRIIVMGGLFEKTDDLKIDWNILCDPVAADIVVNSGIDIDFVSLDVTTRIPLLKDDIKRLRQSEKPVVKKIVEALDLWIKKVNARNGTPLLHDPLTAAVLVKPDLVKWRKGTVNIGLTNNNTCGFTSFKEDNQGCHRYAYHTDPRAVVSFFLEKILSEKRSFIPAISVVKSVKTSRLNIATKI